jgi:hypothetical protein
MPVVAQPVMLVIAPMSKVEKNRVDLNLIFMVVVLFGDGFFCPA